MDRRKLNKVRYFSEQIRRKAVHQFRSGTYTTKELGILNQAVYKNTPTYYQSLTIQK